MKRVIGISETVFDILFRDGKPVAGVPGGSVFNGMISIGRTGIEGYMISDAGDDQIGALTIDFMVSNGVSADYVTRHKGKKSDISVAFLNESNDAVYSFYKDYKNPQRDFLYPPVNDGDVILFGSYYALNPDIRPKTGPFLRHAKEQGAILYYDLNFRPNHSHEKERLMDTVIENITLADIVRGSSDDFNILYGTSDSQYIWDTYIKERCSSFIMTRGSDGVTLHTRAERMDYPSKAIQTVSTIGAGDSFNAGIVYGLVRHDIGRESIPALDNTLWDKLIGYGIEFGSEVCQSTENYISRELAQAYRLPEPVRK